MRRPTRLTELVQLLQSLGDLVEIRAGNAGAEPLMHLLDVATHLSVGLGEALEPFRTPGGTRRYSDEDLERLGLIQELTAEGVNLEGVRRILELQSENNRLRGQVDRLRRLLGEAQSRTGADAPRTSVFQVNVARRRNLPDIRRDTPFGEM